MNSPVVDKAQLRKELLRRRGSLSAAKVKELNEVLNGCLRAWLTRQPLQNIFGYFSHRGEPNIASLLDGDKENAMPRILEDCQMEFVKYQSCQETRTNRFGIAEPIGLDVVTPNAQTVILIPCLALDRGGHRLGYGKGYYDRYLMRFPAAIRVGVAFEDFVLSSLPADPHDQPVHFIATEEGVRAPLPVQATR